MGAVRAIASGRGDLPDDARICLLASALVHGARTGIHPRRGSIDRQRQSYAQHWGAALLTVQLIDARTSQPAATPNG